MVGCSDLRASHAREFPDPAIRMLPRSLKIGSPTAHYCHPALYSLLLLPQSDVGTLICDGLKATA
jgi:hypothetical protein